MIYNKENPFFASVKDRYPLSKPGSHKNTLHLTLDLRGSGLTYEVGDSIGIFPVHDYELVKKTLAAAKATGHELVFLKQTDFFFTFEEFLIKKGNITDVSPKLVREVYARQSNEEKKHQLEVLLNEENRGLLKEYLGRHEVWDFLESHPEVSFAPQELADLLMPLLPRFYSISSAQSCVGEEVHLTIAPLEYEANGHKRRGVCTHYLCELSELHNPVVPVFIQPSHGFRLPKEEDASLLMIGPGTGIAPFRAFLQERVLFNRSIGKHWLFFGEWNREFDFFYEEEWSFFQQQGHLQLDLAFSRDQQNKVYVQHKMLEQGEEFFRWLEEGAYLYVCGDAQKMAKDVEAALQTIIQEFGRLGAQEARDYIKKLRQQKRYLRDVY
ncbi:MAG: sulfite reductase [Candidatus Protochlamydia sp.]|nr:sulfite reductase [Candidatus Protochlamydia sp.]